MLFDDTYFTIDKPTEGTFRDRGSKFIAFAYPISSDSEIKEIVARLKTEHAKANHHCWAMRLGMDRSVFRVNDDGEPPGLINAYRSAAEEALNAAKVIEKTVNDVYTIRFDYQQMNEVMRIIKGYGLEVLEQQFDNLCVVKIAIRKTEVNRSITRLEKLDRIDIKLYFV